MIKEQAEKVADSDFDLEADDLTKERFLRECERVKIALSTSFSTQFIVKNYASGRDFELDVSQSEFKDKLEENMLPMIEEGIKSAFKDIEDGELDKVFFIGGVSRMPLLSEWVKEYVESSDIVDCDTFIHLDAELSVATGAALLAYSMADKEPLAASVVLDKEPVATSLKLTGLPEKEKKVRMI